MQTPDTRTAPPATPTSRQMNTPVTVTQTTSGWRSSTTTTTTTASTIITSPSVVGIRRVGEFESPNLAWDDTGSEGFRMAEHLQDQFVLFPEMQSINVPRPADDEQEESHDPLLKFAKQLMVELKENVHTVKILQEKVNLLQKELLEIKEEMQQKENSFVPCPENFSHPPLQEEETVEKQTKAILELGEQVRKLTSGEITGFTERENTRISNQLQAVSNNYYLTTVVIKGFEERQEDLKLSNRKRASKILGLLWCSPLLDHTRKVQFFTSGENQETKLRLTFTSTTAASYALSQLAIGLKENKMGENDQRRKVAKYSFAQMTPPKLSNERSELQDKLKKMKKKKEISRWYYVMNRAELAAMAFKKGDSRPILIKSKVSRADPASSRQRRTEGLTDLVGDTLGSRNSNPVEMVTDTRPPHDDRGPMNTVCPGEEGAPEDEGVNGEGEFVARVPRGRYGRGISLPLNSGWYNLHNRQASSDSDPDS